MEKKTFTCYFCDYENKYEVLNQNNVITVKTEDFRINDTVFRGKNQVESNLPCVKCSNKSKVIINL